MRWSFVAVLALTACRYGFETDGDGGATGNVDGTGDGRACAFGTVVHEYLFPGPRDGIYDSRRIVVMPDRVLVGVTTLNGPELQAFDHTLVPKSAGRATLAGASNFSLGYGQGRNELVTFEVVSATPQLRTYTVGGSMLLRGPSPTGDMTGSGFVSPDGHVHAVIRTVGGVREFAPDLTFVRTWGSDSPFGGEDAVLDTARNRAWIGSQNGVAAYDFSMSPPVKQFVVTLPGVDTNTDNADAMAVDDRGILYVINRPSSTMYMLQDNAIVDMHVFAGEDPVTVEYDPFTGLLLIGFLEGEVAHVRALCPYVSAAG